MLKWSHGIGITDPTRKTVFQYNNQQMTAPLVALIVQQSNSTIRQLDTKI